MGIDCTALEVVLISQKYVSKRRRMLTLGRQGLHAHPDNIDEILEKHLLYHLKGRYIGEWCEPLFKDLNFEVIESLDNSSYEGATRIHDMNRPLPPNSPKYDYIFDGGTIEHIFNTPQLCENIINSLEIGGIFCSVTSNNNLSGHGIYQFSPEFFLSAFSPKYGMKIQELYIGIVGTPRESWIDVNSFNKGGGGRNCAKFNSADEVYVITIAKKISDERLNLITDSPQQYSYEHGDWIKSAAE